MPADRQAPEVGVVGDQVMLIVRLTIRPGAQAEMNEALDRLVDATRHDRGVVRFEVGIDPADDTRVVGYETWDSQDALDEHAAQRRAPSACSPAARIPEREAADRRHDPALSSSEASA